MYWRGTVWREAGNYGPGGRFEPQRALGAFTLPDTPEIGMIVELADGGEYEVVWVDIFDCEVRPTRLEPR